MLHKNECCFLPLCQRCSPLHAVVVRVLNFVKKTGYLFHKDLIIILALSYCQERHSCDFMSYHHCSLYHYTVIACDAI